MSYQLDVHAQVVVNGAGSIGAGIGQFAVQAGHVVWLHDTTPGSAVAAVRTPQNAKPAVAG